MIFKFRRKAVILGEAHLVLTEACTLMFQIRDCFERNDLDAGKLMEVIALAAMNGLAPLFEIHDPQGAHPFYALGWGNVGVMAIANLVVVVLIWVLESERLVGHTSTKLVLYDRIDLIVPEKREELIADLEKRVGVKVENLEIGHVDFLRDAAFIKVYYTLGKNQTASIDQLTKAKDFVEQ